MTDRITAASPDRSSAASDRVLAAFQETMQTFLEVQRTTMLAYLSGRQQDPRLPADHAGARTSRGSIGANGGVDPGDKDRPQLP